MQPLSEYVTSVVRLFPDYAGTVLWFMDPVPYEVTHLSAKLRRDLEAWEQYFNGAFTEDFEWRSDDGHRHFIEEGRRLAKRLAGELGEAFSVEFKSYEGGSRRNRFHSSGPPLNPDAAAAFTALAEAARAEHDYIHRLHKGGASLSWSVSAPGIGVVLSSDESGRRKK